MPSPNPDSPVGTRDRMIAAAIDGLKRQGVAGMSFTDVLAASGAARGAIYHHFPAGKSQLVAEAATTDGGQVRDRLAALPGDTPAEVTEAFLATVQPVVAASAKGSGCAVAALSLNADPSDHGLREIAAGQFESWTGALADRLAQAGAPPDRAADTATTLIMLLEGAHVLCRAAGTIVPFERQRA